MVKIKVCGITDLEDALFAADLGVDALGFIFYPGSPRYVQPQKAREIIRQLPPFVTRVGVFVNEDVAKIKEILNLTGINLLQLHGQEPPEYCQQFEGIVIKAFRVTPDFDLKQLLNYKVNAYLLDTYVKERYGGTGRTFDWEIARRATQYGRVVLAGGLNLDNIEEAIRQVRPYAVDVSSGVEARPGKKDREKLKRLVCRVKDCR